MLTFYDSDLETKLHFVGDIKRKCKQWSIIFISLLFTKIVVSWSFDNFLQKFFPASPLPKVRPAWKTFNCLGKINNDIEVNEEVGDVHDDVDED